MAQKVILFTPMDGHGHINSCVGVAQVLLAKGHRIVFAVDAAWKGKLAEYGFEEELISTDDKDDSEEYWQVYLAEHGEGIVKEELFEVFNNESTKIMIERHKMTEPILKEIITRVKPDLLVVDAYFCSPAVTNSGIPWVYMFSAGPLLVVYDPEKMPPPGSGFSINDDKEKWKEYNEKSLKSESKHWHTINDWVVEQGAPPLEFPKCHPESPYLNIYFYPEEIDYLDVRPLPSNWHRFDSLVRQSDHEVFEIPEKLKNKAGKLIYFSMGSFASAYSPMMKMLVDVLKDSPHRFIVSKGAEGDKYDLPDNMWGANFLPQTKVIPLVDLVITHGGNNTITESFYYGKPMVVLPLFGDQHDNAQRIQDKGFGIRLKPFKTSQKDFLDAIEKLVNDNELKVKMEKIANRIQNSKSNEKAAELFEDVLNK